MVGDDLETLPPVETLPAEILNYILNSRIYLFNRNLQQMVVLTWLLLLREGQFTGTMAALSSSWFKGPYVIRVSALGSDAHIYLSLSASHLLSAKALPRVSGYSFVNLKSPAHFLGTQLFAEWFKNRRKMSIPQPPCAPPGPWLCGHHLLC